MTTHSDNFQPGPAASARIEVETIVLTASAFYNIMFRCINNSDYPVRFQQLKLTLTDENQNLITIERDINIVLQHSGHRLIEVRVVLDPPSAFDPYGHVTSNIDFKVAAEHIPYSNK